MPARVAHNLNSSFYTRPVRAADLAAAFARANLFFHSDDLPPCRSSARAGESLKKLQRVEQKKPLDLALQNDFRVLLVVHVMAELIKAGELKDRMKKIPEWELEKKHIERTFEFDDFADAIDFVNAVAEVAEEEEHHPDIDIRYNKVRLVLSTHSKGGVTELDFGLAERIDTLAE
jgi:4a-hydroxytetrahydrobiopterin dehydratase